MFATTRVFLDYFGLKKLDDLPPLADLSDWESLRVQLNLPEVEEDSASETAEVMDLPVLYPEIEGEESDDAIPEPRPDIDEGDDADVGQDAELDALVVSEWPDPAERGS
jgi:segregation and condensation protein B